jgi:hypothetical protein
MKQGRLAGKKVGKLSGMMSCQMARLTESLQSSKGERWPKRVSGDGACLQRRRRCPGDQLERFPTPANPSLLLPPYPRRGRKGEQTQTRRSRISSQQTGHFCPPKAIRGRNEPEQTAAGAKRPVHQATDRRAACQHDAGGPFARRRPHQRAEGGRQAVAAGDRSEAEPESPRRRSRGVRSCFAGYGQSVIDILSTLFYYRER